MILMEICIKTFNITTNIYLCDKKIPSVFSLYCVNMQADIYLHIYTHTPFISGLLGNNIPSI